MRFYGINCVLNDKISHQLFKPKYNCLPWNRYCYHMKKLLMF